MDILETIRLNINDLKSQQAALKLQVKLVQRSVHTTSNLDSVLEQLTYLKT